MRSKNGKWQYRAKEGDLKGHPNHKKPSKPHVHLEELNPKTGEVIRNYHLYWGE